ncbi:aminobenzoyl-glutamate utilization protein B [Sphingomonas gellani]|uniref:Aminobenzoyl-glutamate utilization protein B n=1 Tax=Sphingomonas gellani TaxID=1166340 RepID=A0A1H8CT03_9SPHN|nr:amidohydrolase [Sphingomonas gellani]SEM98361.1 aminobenzoyl-glutamate utilization protein B [Sphingomonas gellani]
MKTLTLLATAMATVATPAVAQQLAEADSRQVLANVNANEQAIGDTALAIWKYAEVGYKETQSSALLQSKLKAAGFTVRAGVAGEPTAFVASFRSGAGPVIGVLAEYDALPGLSQRAEPVRAPGTAAAGHGCGHNLFGTASTYAAIAVKEWMVKNKVGGEIRVYGTPAEEGGSGKVYMVRAGLFNDVDTVLHWHPGNANSAVQGPSMANISGKFRFHGKSAHAAGAPDKGRSALDGVEAMDAMTNLMREHIPDRTRIHYVITKGGKAPNVVPDEAEVYYYVRHTDPQIVKDTWKWVTEAAQGAAMGTQTKVDWEITGGVYSLLPNEALMGVMDRSLHTAGTISWTPEETAFARKLQESMTSPPPIDSVGTIVPARIADDALGGSTDVADVSWTTPTVGLSTATFVPGSAGHSWQNVAAAGSSIGVKGAVLASKTLALTAADLFRSPATIQAAKQEFAAKRGANFKYQAMLGDRQPPLDYRDGAAD